MSDRNDEAAQLDGEDAVAFLAGEEIAWDAPPAGEPASVDPEAEQFDADYRRHRSAFESIVRGHLHVQAALIQYVEAGLEHPGALDLARMDFVYLVQLAVALGLIEKDDAAGYKRLNHLRNRFAHNIRAEISLQDGIDLYNSLGERFQRETAMAAQKPFRDEHLPDLIYRSIKVLHDRVVKQCRFLLAVAQEPGGTDDDEDDESVVPATPLESVPNSDAP
jgi:hypothetical protein